MNKGKMFVIGLGLIPKHLTLLAIEALKKVDEIYMDSYTSILLDDSNELIKIMGKKPKYLTRKNLEEEGVKFFKRKLDNGVNIALLVVGDPHIATTHISLINELKMRGYNVSVIPGISVLCASITYSGLISYKFGKPVTLVLPKEGIEFDYPYKVIKENKERNLHTFLFLDIDIEKGIYMTIPKAIKILFDLENKFKENVINYEEIAIGMARLGSSSQLVCVDKLSKLKEIDFGKPPHSLIVLSPKLHFVEEESLEVLKNEFRERCKQAS